MVRAILRLSSLLCTIDQWVECSQSLFIALNLFMQSPDGARSIIDASHACVLCANTVYECASKLRHQHDQKRRMEGREGEKGGNTSVDSEKEGSSDYCLEASFIFLSVVVGNDREGKVAESVLATLTSCVRASSVFPASVTLWTSLCIYGIVREKEEVEQRYDIELALLHGMMGVLLSLERGKGGRDAKYFAALESTVWTLLSLYRGGVSDGSGNGEKKGSESEEGAKREEAEQKCREVVERMNRFRTYLHRKESLPEALMRLRTSLDVFYFCKAGQEDYADEVHFAHYSSLRSSFHHIKHTHFDDMEVVAALKAVDELMSNEWCKTAISCIPDALPLLVKCQNNIDEGVMENACKTLHSCMEHTTLVQAMYITEDGLSSLSACLHDYKSAIRQHGLSIVRMLARELPESRQLLMKSALDVDVLSILKGFPSDDLTLELAGEALLCLSDFLSGSLAFQGHLLSKGAAAVILRVLKVLVESGDMPQPKNEEEKARFADMSKKRVLMVDSALAVIGSLSLQNKEGQRALLAGGVWELMELVARTSLWDSLVVKEGWLGAAINLADQNTAFQEMCLKEGGEMSDIIASFLHSEGEDLPGLGALLTSHLCWGKQEGSHLHDTLASPSLCTALAEVLGRCQSSGHSRRGSKSDGGSSRRRSPFFMDSDGGGEEGRESGSDEVVSRFSTSINLQDSLPGREGGDESNSALDGLLTGASSSFEWASARSSPKEGSVDGSIQLLDRFTLMHALTAVANLCFGSPTAQSQLREAGIAASLLPLLRSSVFDVKLHTCFALGNFIKGCPANAKELAECGGMPLLLSLITDNDEDEVSKRAFVVIANMQEVAVDHLLSFTLECAVSNPPRSGCSDERAALTASTTTLYNGASLSSHLYSVDSQSFTTALLVLNGLVYTNELNQKRVVEKGGLKNLAVVLLTKSPATVMETALFVASNLTTSRERGVQQIAVKEGLLGAVVAFLSLSLADAGAPLSGSDSEEEGEVNGLALTLLSNITLQNNENAKEIASSSRAPSFFDALFSAVTGGVIDAQRWILGVFELPSLKATLFQSRWVEAIKGLESSPDEDIAARARSIVRENRL
uniref:Uncharacterized protein n=1 Tax=Palpitomonas bilix TaxID=652834 RepID=A0A7S3G8F1_9EUKA